MSIIELGALGEFIGSIAVLVTLGYLAMQIRQNTRVMRNTASQSIIDSGRDDLSNIRSHGYEFEGNNEKYGQQVKRDLSDQYLPNGDYKDNPLSIKFDKSLRDLEGLCRQKMV